MLQSPMVHINYSQRADMTFSATVEGLVCEAGPFSDKQIDKFKKEYGKLPKLTYEQGNKLKDKVGSFPTSVLKQLADEDIPWITMLAKLKLEKK